MYTDVREGVCVYLEYMYIHVRVCGCVYVFVRANVDLREEYMLTWIPAYLYCKKKRS